ncbi:MAG: ribonuclease H-like domain-containing protein, partial [Anaerolineae bacterium]|nr:ribonuclease H-like domain-containing protein [Anaerolineae bacterium]
MLELLHDLIRQHEALVTFNGRTFDVPLLTDRYLLNRRRTALGVIPNLDLLPPARRLWKRRLPSCALGALEGDILNIQRTEQDVPGSLIPYLYQQYLRTRDARDMARVLYHNRLDLLSMVTLGATIAQIFARAARQPLPIHDRISMARWYGSRGLRAESEHSYRQALDEAPDAETRYDALLGLAQYLKQAERRAEALPLWEDLADLRLDVTGHEELAKHYEWHEIDLRRALAWAEQGIRTAQGWRNPIDRYEALRRLEHRRNRLLRKINGEGGADERDEADAD